MTEGRIPPCDLDAERVVLARCLLDGSALAEVLARLQPDDWYSPAHQVIWAAAAELGSHGSTVDLATVAGYLRDRQKLQDCGGAQYLAKLVNEEVAIVDVGAQVQRLSELSRRRRVLAAALLIVGEGYGDVGDSEEWLARSVAAVSRAAGEGRADYAVTLRDAMTEFMARIQSQGLHMLSTGLPSVDHQLGGGLCDGDVTIVAGRPGTGKSAAVLQIVLHGAHAGNDALNDSRGAVVLYSLEMPTIQIAARALASFGGVNHARLRKGDLDSDEWGHVTTAATDLAPRAVWIDDSPALTVVEIHRRTLALHAKIRRERGYGIQLVVVDYLQLARAGERTQAREQAVSLVSRGLKCLAKELNGHVVAACQLNRAVESRGKNARPVLSDLRESGAIEQDADNVIMLWRDDSKGLAEWIVEKQRNGPKGTVSMSWTGDFTRYDERT